MRISTIIAAPLLLSLASFGVASAIAAQTPNKTITYNDALAAGYNAQFMCSGIFNGGKKVADIQSDELTGVYDNIADILQRLEAKIDYQNKLVSVDYGASQPRYAIWNANSGCTGMPIGWKAPTKNGIIFIKPATRIRIAAGGLDNRNWPLGDQNSSAITSNETLSAQQLKQYASVQKLAGSLISNPQNAYGGKSSAVLIVHKGKIVAEAYKSGHNLHTSQRTWSVAKSIGGTFAGYVAQKSKLNVQASLGLWGKDDPRNTITIDDAMRMTSGLYSDTAGNRTDPIYMGGASVSERTTSWPSIYAPNTQYRYSNNDILLATMAIRKAAPKLHPHQMFDALGMTRTFAETDWQGNYLLSSQVWTTSRDLARMGLLYINNGNWPYGINGPRRILPENWRNYVSNASGPQPQGDLGYGATFWLMNALDGVPKDAISANGNRGQYLVIIPSMDLIIVRRGYDSADQRFNLQSFTKDIVKLMTI